VEFRHVGGSGLVVSVLGLGCAQLGRSPSEPGRRVIPEERSRAVIRAALDAGITLFDTSDSYGDSEEVLGRYLGRQREHVVLATKFGTTLKGALGNDFGRRGARRYVRRAIERSLRRLGTEWIDLYQVHQPDLLTPIDETLAVLSDLVREGKVRYIGTSNVPAGSLVDADRLARERGHERFVSVQRRYNLLDREIEADVVPACERCNIGLIPWRPLATGHLTGRYDRVEGSRATGAAGLPSESALSTLDRLGSFARERGIPMLAVALGGLAAQRVVSSIIAGATSQKQVDANVRAVSWRPSSDDLVELDRVCPRGASS
jgi:aryl-alcohol dehydrogenase-like predicted oxidoreductase